MILQKLGITPKMLKSLIGASLIKLGTSVTTCWGNINLYFMSYFHYQGTEITAQTNAKILAISLLPMILALVFSTKLCNKYGYIFIIRICSFVFGLAPLVNIFSFNIYTFVIFSIIIPGSMFALASVPVLNCMWTLFPNSKNKITAVLVIVFGTGSILWNFVFMHMINPNNQDTVGQIKDENIHIFSQNITQNVQKTAIIGYGITGLLSTIGSFLLQRNDETQQQLKQQVEGIDNPNIGSGQGIAMPKQPQLTFKQSIKDQKFILVMIISVLTGLYQIQLIMNFKIILMPIIGDDHFLGYCIMLCQIVAICGAFIWGSLGDLKGAAFTILILSVLDFGGKMFSDFALNKATIIMMVILIGFISKSMTTIAGPAFVQFYGLRIGTQMLPWKGVALLVGYIIVPSFQILTADYLTPHQYLVCISFFSIVTLGCSIRLYMLAFCRKQEQKQTFETEKDKKLQAQVVL